MYKGKTDLFKNSVIGALKAISEPSDHTIVTETHGKNQDVDTVDQRINLESLAISINILADVILTGLKVDTVDSAAESQFQGFPPEIAAIIIDILHAQNDKATIICLGLACRSYWYYLKSKPKSYYRFSIIENQLALRKQMIGLIGSWLGPNYRRPGCDSEHIETLFLSRTMYGDIPGEKEQALEERWRDYKTLVIHENKLNWHQVPSPFGMTAEEWFPLAARKLKKNILGWVGFWLPMEAALYRKYRTSCLCQWLLSNGDGAAWRKHKFQNMDVELALLLSFPDEGQEFSSNYQKPKHDIKIKTSYYIKQAKIAAKNEAKLKDYIETKGSGTHFLHHLP
ncbi:hypothetical protein NHQ30_011697 [Ciborinia camelliae]|nr:hypothetical protein NHQ30_011697 [Ciborinia camelliae]